LHVGNHRGAGVAHVAGAVYGPLQQISGIRVGVSEDGSVSVI
jgi:hypothetical protein